LETAARDFLESLVIGEPVEVFDEWGNVRWRGVVEEVAPPLGVAWIRTDATERKLLDIREHAVQRLSQVLGYPPVYRRG
jgi:hypothetical protein